jgi:cyclase
MTNKLIQKLFFSLTFVFSASLAFAQPQPSPIELVQLQDDLYVIFNPAVPGNVTVLVTDEGVIMVDDKFAWDYENIMSMIASITDQPVKYVINTHFHGDHSGGNEQAQADGAVVVASENARIKFIESNQGGVPDITLDEHAFVHLGGKVVELFRFGQSHTDGDVVVYFPEHGVLAAGDMFTYGNDVPQLIDYAGGGSARAWSRTLDEVLRLDFDTVVPGHGPITSKNELANFRDSTIRLRNRTRELLSGGASRDDVEQMLRREFYWGDLHVGRGLDGLIAEVQ